MLPEKRLDEMPVLKGFIQQDPSRTTKWLNRFYELREEAEQLVKTSNRLREHDRWDEAEAMRDKNPWAFGGVGKNGHDQIAAGFSSTAKQLGNVRKEIMEVLADTSLSAHEKRVQLDDLYDERNKLATEAKDLEKEKYGN